METRGSYFSPGVTLKRRPSRACTTRVKSCKLLQDVQGENSLSNRYISSPHEPADIPVTTICDEERGQFSLILTHFYHAVLFLTIWIIIHTDHLSTVSQGSCCESTEWRCLLMFWPSPPKRTQSIGTYLKSSFFESRSNSLALALIMLPSPWYSWSSKVTWSKSSGWEIREQCLQNVKRSAMT